MNLSAAVVCSQSWLRFIVAVLSMMIQLFCQVEDARVAMRLYQLRKKSWEETLKARIGPTERRQLKAINSKKKYCQVITRKDMKQHVFSKPFNVMLHSD